ncbi:MAG: hypothetical protein WB493_17050, partial [Anaeromyxobacteraceae bacterium]
MGCAVSIAALLVTGCDAAGPAAEPRPPEVSMEGVQFRAWRGADLAASGTAARAVYLRDEGLVDAADARVT